MMVHPFSPSKAPRQPQFRGASPRSAPRFGQDAFEPSFLPVQPQQAIGFSYETTLRHLKQRLGQTQVHRILDQRLEVPSPAQGQPNSDWLKRAKIIEVNQRILGSYWNLVKYALTFPEDTILLKPVFETGGFGQNLYSMASWKLNDEFRDPELAVKGFPTTAQQLKLSVNLLHAMGKKVGMDIAQHTDRFSETVFAYPDFFEWLEISPDKRSIADYTPEDKVKKQIQTFLREKGDADGRPLPEAAIQNLFEDSTSEEARLNILFGPADGPQGKRQARKGNLMHYLHDRGLETAPLVYNAPYRPVEVTEPYGGEWAEFKVQGARREEVIGVLTPYKQYQLREDGVPDLSRPNVALWDYMARHIQKLQQDFGFDFLRADVGHLQMNQYKVEQPNTGDNFWRHIKESVGKQAPHFATFQENFYMPAFIDPAQDADIKGFDATLGYVQNLSVGDADFLPKVKERLDQNTHHRFSVALSTTDTDNKDERHLLLNEPDLLAKAFLGFFLDRPSYMSMGLETRDSVPPQRQNPEDYRRFTHSYITKAQAPYQWGDNQAFFSKLTALREQFERLRSRLAAGTSQWLTVGQDAAQDVAAWFYPATKRQPGLLFALNTNLDKTHSNVSLELPPSEKIDGLAGMFSTANQPLKRSVTLQGRKVSITNLAPGEGRIYRVATPEKKNSKNVSTSSWLGFGDFLGRIFQRITAFFRRLSNRLNSVNLTGQFNWLKPEY